MTTLRLYIKQVLWMELGYSVEIARDGVEALEKLKQRSYDLIITDNNMPRMRGEDLYKEALKLNNGLASKTLVVSATASDFMRSNGSFLEKPFSAEQLIEAVRDLLGRTS
jgi:two-component system chemotaxis response regulator CheY